MATLQNIVSQANTIHEKIKSSLLSVDLKDECCNIIGPLLQMSKLQQLDVCIITDFSSTILSYPEELLQDATGLPLDPYKLKRHCKINFGKRKDLIINLVNEKPMCFSKNVMRFLETFLPDKAEKISLWKRFVIKLKSLLGLHQENVHLEEIAAKLHCTVDSIGVENIEIISPTLTLQDAKVTFLEPMVQANNDRIKEIVQNAHILLVITPVDAPLSIDLADMIDWRLNHGLTDNVFLLDGERTMQKSAFDYAVVKIKSVTGLKEPSILTLNKSEKAFAAFMTYVQNKAAASLYEVAKIKLEVAKERISSILKTHNEMLMQETEALTLNKTLPIEDFSTNFFLKIDINNLLAVVKERMINKIDEQKDALLRQINTQILKEKKKKAIQSVMSKQETIENCSKSFNYCYQQYANSASELKDYYKNVMERFTKDFEKTFGIKPLQMNLETQSQKEEIKYNPRFYKKGVTTIAIIRFFKKVQTIRNQMHKAVANKLQSDFAFMSDKYEAWLISESNLYKKKFEQIKQTYNKTFSKNINNRIQKENQYAESLKGQIASISEIIASVK